MGCGARPWSARSRVAHKVRAEGAVLRQLVGEPAGYERQVPPQRVGDRPGELEVPGGWGESAGW